MNKHDPSILKFIVFYRHFPRSWEMSIKYPRRQSKNNVFNFNQTTSSSVALKNFKQEIILILFKLFKKSFGNGAGPIQTLF